MLIIKTENNRQFYYPMKENRITIPVLSSAIHIKKQDGKYLFTHSGDLICETPRSVIDENDLIFSRNGGYALISFCRHDQNFNKYAVCKIPEKVISVGTSPADSFFLKDKRLNATRIYIDIQRHLIHSSGGFPASLNGRVIKAYTTFKNNDVFSVLNLKIVFHPVFIFVSEPDNLVSSLVRPEHIPFIDRHDKQCCLKLSRSWLNVNPVNRLEMNLKPMTLPAEIENSPLIVALGPMLMMSLASVSSGLISAFRSIRQGFGIFEYAPSLILPFTMLTATLLWTPLQRRYEKKRYKRQSAKATSEYDEYLEGMIREIIAFTDKYISDCNVLVKPTQSLIDLLNEKNPEIRRSSDAPNLLKIRLGCRRGVLKVNIKENISPVKNSSEALIALLNKLEEDPELPMILDLQEYKSILIRRAEYSHFLIMHILLQTAAYLDEKDFGIALCVDQNCLRDYAYLRKLPHCFSRDGQCLWAKNDDQLKFVFAVMEEEKKRHFILITDHDIYTDIPGNLTSVIYKESGSKAFRTEHDLMLECHQSEAIATDYIKNESFTFKHEIIPRDELKLAEILGNLPKHYSFNRVIGFIDLFDIDTFNELDIAEKWRNNKASDGLNALIGMDFRNKNISLNLHEKGDGPHGLIAGTTGSGKSELMCCLILSLAVTYSPREVTLVLIDFKGGGVASAFTEKGWRLPHIAGIISNLDTSQMERALIGLKNECIKREKLFLKMSEITGANVKNIDEYQALWSSDMNLEYPAHLIIIVDEFAQLKADRPEFLNDLISISRIGRSLGMHLILATQKPSGIISDQIWSNCRYKICLRVAEKQDSFEVIHSDEAMYLKEPGMFCLYKDGSLIKGRAGYASKTVEEGKPNVEILDATLRAVNKKKNYTGLLSETTAVLKEIKKYVNNFPPAKQIWMNPAKNYPRNVVADERSLAVIDDIYEGKYSLLKADFAQNAVQIIYTPDQTARQNMFLNYLFAALCETDAASEIYIIDDVRIFNKNICCCFDCLKDHITSDETEKIACLFRHIEDDIYGNIIIFVTDILSLLQGGYEIREKMGDLIRCHHKYKLSFVFGASSASDIPPRYETYINRAIALKNDSLRELSSALRVTVKKTIKDAESGLLYNEKLYEIKLIKTSVSDILHKIPSLYKKT